MELTKHNVRLQEVKGDGCRLGIKSPVGALRGSEPVVSSTQTRAVGKDC